MKIHLSHTIAMGHRIPGHEGGQGKCARLHGHTYRFDVTAMSPGLRDGFVIDFGVIKNALNDWDHRTILWDQDPLRVSTVDDDPLGDIHIPHSGIIRVPFIPTAEAIAMFWADDIYADLLVYHGVEHEPLPADVYAVAVEVWESPTTSARYVRR